MASRAPTGPAGPAPLRAEVLKELQALLEDRDARDRLDRGPLAETKGREHWLLHLLLRAHELGQAHVSNLVGTAYANLAARLQAGEEGFARLEANQQRLQEEFGTLARRFEEGLSARLASALAEGKEGVSAAVVDSLDQKWKPISESIDTFSRASHQLSKDISDTYRVATQTRLLLNENARRMIDLGRDLVALEEGLKLSLGKLLDERLQLVEERLAALEGRAPTDAASPPSTAAELPRAD